MNIPKRYEMKSVGGRPAPASTDYEPPPKIKRPKPPKKNITPEQKLKMTIDSIAPMIKKSVFSLIEKFADPEPVVNPSTPIATSVLKNFADQEPKIETLEENKDENGCLKHGSV